MSKPNTYYKRVFDHESILNFKNNILMTDWSDLTNANNSTDQWNFLLKIIDKKFNESFPLKKSSNKTKNIPCPWINNEIKTLSKYCSYLDFDTLISWATLNGAEALGMSDTLGSFDKGKMPGILLLQNLSEDKKIKAETTVSRIC